MARINHILVCGGLLIITLTGSCSMTSPFITLVNIVHCSSVIDFSFLANNLNNQS